MGNAFIDELLAATKSRLSTRLQNASGFSLIHSDAKLKQIINKGIDLHLADDVVDDLIFISCRNAKPIDADELIQQMDNWVNVVSKRGYPYKFNDLGQFNQFKNELKDGLNGIGLSTADVRIQGSSLRSPNANDVDIVSVITQNDFDGIIKSFYNGKILKNGSIVDISSMNNQQLRNLADDIYNNKTSYNKIAKEDFLYNLKSQMINAKPDKGVINGLKQLKEALQLKYPNLNIENIAIQVASGNFDLKPFMKL